MPNLERRYKETESPAVREELSKFISERPCPACHGQRLNRSARNVFVGAKQGTDPKSSAATVEIELTPNLKLETDVGADANSKAGINWEWNY